MAVLMTAMSFTQITAMAAPVDDAASSALIAPGGQVNDYIYTQTQDDSYHELYEVQVGGPPAKPYMGLEAEYEIIISDGTTGPYLFSLNAFHSGTENYDISYQVNDGGYSSLGQVTFTSDNNVYQTWSLSGITAGDVVDIHFEDAERVKSEPADNLYIDHMKITSQSAANQAPNEPHHPEPLDGAVDVETSPVLSVTVDDPDGDAMDVFFYDGFGSLIFTDYGITSGSTATAEWPNLPEGETMYWYATAYDGEFYTQSPSWSFTTIGNSAPDAPVLPGPANGATDVELDPWLAVHVSDPDGDAMDVSFYDAIGTTLIGTDYGVPSGSAASVQWPDRLQDMTYYWFAVADDGELTTQSATWSFTTIVENMAAPDAPTNPSPMDGIIGVSTNPALSVDVSDPDGNPMDVSFHDAGDDSLIGTDEGVLSGGTASVDWLGLESNTLYNWYAVADDGIFSTQSATWAFTTASVDLPAPPTDLTVEYWGLGTPPEDTATGVAVYLGYLAGGDTADTREQDDVTNVYGETEAGGPPSRPYMGLEIQYSVPITIGTVEPYYLYLDAYHSSTEDYDVSYRINGGDLISLGQITDTIDTDTYLTWELPGVAAEDTVSVHIQDESRERNEGLDLVYIDHLYIKSDTMVVSTDHNALNWTLSADDGAGDNDVLEYVIYRSDYFTGPWDEAHVLATVPAGTDSYVDEDKGMDDDTGWWYVVRARDTSLNLETNTNNVKEPGNTAPNSIYDGSPNDVNASTNPMLKIRVYDPENDFMDVYFYEYSTNDLIGIDYCVRTGMYAMLEWSGLSEYTTYSWYVIASDGLESMESNFYTFTTGTDDTDGDKLQDAEETLVGTNMNLPDTDGDGFTDFEEVVIYESDAIGTQNWVGYFITNQLYSLIGTEATAYVDAVETLTGISTQLIQGSWADQYGLKSDILTQYGNGMLGATLMGSDMPVPMYFYDNEGYGLGNYGDELKPCGMYYMDLDGSWSSYKPYNFYSLDYNVYGATTKATEGPAISYNYYVGAGGKLLKELYSNPEVHPTDIASGTAEDLWAIDYNPNTYESVFVGNNGVMRLLLGTEAIQTISTGTSNDLFGVSWSPDYSKAIAVGQGGTVLKYTTSVASLSSGVSYDLNDIAFDSSGDALIVGDSGTVLLLEGDTITTIASGTGTNLNAVQWVENDTFALIVGEGGAVMKYDGTLSILDLGSTEDLNSIDWNPQEGIAMIVGNAGTIINYKGTSNFELITTEITNDLYFVNWEDNSLFTGYYENYYYTANFGGAPGGFNFGKYSPQYLNYHYDGAGDVTPDIWTGDLRPPVWDMNQQATYLLNYFNRAIDYLDGTMTTNGKVLSYADRTDFGHIALVSARDAQDAYSDFTIVHDEDATADDYLWRLENEQYELVTMIVHGSSTSQSIYGGPVRNTDINAIDQKSQFYILNSCSNADYRTEQYIAGEYGFSSSYSLGVFASSKTSIYQYALTYFEHMNDGHCMGTSMLNWLNEWGLPYFSLSKEAQYGGSCYIGDPLLIN